MRRMVGVVIVMTMVAGCATVPEQAYYPDPRDARTRVVAEALWRAARAASEDPHVYSFAMIRTAQVRALTADDATFYFSEGLAAQSGGVIDALVAHEVAHELLDHVGTRRVVSLSSTGGVTVLGVVLPGLSALDLLANPLIVRAYTRQQELQADRRAVEVLRDMGHATPRRVLAGALRDAAAVNEAAERGRLAAEPELRERLAALEPLEPVALTR